MSAGHFWGGILDTFEVCILAAFGGVVESSGAWRGGFDGQWTNGYSMAFWSF